MVGLGQAMFDTIGFADQIKPHLAKRDAVSVAWLLCELDAVIGENGVDFVGHGIKEIFKERPSCFAIGLFDHVRDRELAGAINGDKEIELVFLGPDFGNIIWKSPIGYRLTFCRLGLSPSMSGSREMPCR